LELNTCSSKDAPQFVQLPGGASGSGNEIDLLAASASRSPAYFPEAELEPVLLGDLLGRLGLALLRLLHGGDREPPARQGRPAGPAGEEGAALELELRLRRPVVAALPGRGRPRRGAGEEQGGCRHGRADGWGSGWEWKEQDEDEVGTQLHSRRGRTR